MKIKILLFPSVVVITISLLIWIVYPAYTNGVDGLKEKTAILKLEETKLKSLQEKQNNINSLSADIARNTDKKNLLYGYIPENMSEQTIYDNLNYIAQQGGVAYVNISISQSSNRSVVSPPVVSADESAGVLPGAVPPPVVAPDYFDAKFVVMGNYESIKGIFDQIFKMDRFKKMGSLKISHLGTSGSSADDAKLLSTSLLQADAVISFSYMKKNDLLPNLENAVFSQKNFDMAIVDKIKNERSMKALDLQTGPAGKTNPFLP